MKATTATAAVLATIVSVVSAIVPSTFGLMALRSASPIHFGTINAYGSSFWIGKRAGTYCPSQLNNTCPNSTETIFSGPSTYGSLSLNVIVPGGQQIYIEPSCGKVRFTTAHSAYMPPGSNVTGWKLDESGDLDFLAWGGGTVFCPTGNGTDPVTHYGIGPWQMYAALPNITLPRGCLGANLLALNATGPRAWQYT